MHQPADGEGSKDSEPWSRKKKEKDLLEKDLLDGEPWPHRATAFRDDSGELGGLVGSTGIYTKAWPMPDPDLLLHTALNSSQQLSTCCGLRSFSALQRSPRHSPRVDAVAKPT